MPEPSLVQSKRALPQETTWNDAVTEDHFQSAVRKANRRLMAVPIVSVIGAPLSAVLFGLHGLAGANPRVVELGIIYFCLPVRGPPPLVMLALSLATLCIFADSAR